MPAAAHARTSPMVAPARSGVPGPGESSTPSKSAAACADQGVRGEPFVVVAPDLRRHAQLTQILDQVEHEAVVVVDDQDAHRHRLPAVNRGMQVTDSARGAALARTLSSYPAALMRGHGNVVVGSSIKQAVVYAAYVDINARMQTQALLLSRDIITMNEPELFKPEEFDINRPWEHLKQKNLDDAAKARVDRAQFGLEQRRRRSDRAAPAH